MPFYFCISYIIVMWNILVLWFSQGLADNTVIAKVNDGVWDLDRPLEADCSLQLLKFDDEEAQAVSLTFPHCVQCNV